MQALQNKKQVLSKQLDDQIKKVTLMQDPLNKSEDNLEAFELLERKLKILQEKLNKVQQNQYQPWYEKHYSLKSNRKYKACTFHNDCDEIGNNQEENVKQKQKIKHNNNQCISEKQKPQNNEKNRINSLGRESQQNQYNNNNSSHKKNNSSTKRKVKRAKSQVSESGQVTNKNSKMTTPQKKKKVIVSHIQFDDNFVKNPQNQPKRQFLKVNSDHNLNKKSSKKIVNLTSRKNQGNFAIDQYSQTNYKMEPRNLSSNKKASLKSSGKQKKSISHKKFQSQINQEKHKRNFNRYPSMVTEQFISQDDPKKLILKLSKKNNISYNVLDHHILSYSRQPLIPLKQKINLERQLKQYSKQSIKLKGQIEKLKIYEQQYWKMKEIFTKFEKYHMKGKKLNTTQK